ncbi:MAG: type II toxin-antitoxin system prevent-host-death family antitoxin [Propionibacteriaceae bacterium]|nr:type II toxin-antitoxin system prevent-host-death family antitoxin [Propionibacteriaceae bacterium]
MHTMTSREFNQQTSRAKLLAKEGPVFITERGEPAFVLMSVEEYRKDHPQLFRSALELFADMPNIYAGMNEEDMDTFDQSFEEILRQVREDANDPKYSRPPLDLEEF